MITVQGRLTPLSRATSKSGTVGAAIIGATAKEDVYVVIYKWSPTS